MIADGSGAMAKVQDHRFGAGDWPFCAEMMGDHADTWLNICMPSARDGDGALAA